MGLKAFKARRGRTMCLGAKKSLRETNGARAKEPLKLNLTSNARHLVFSNTSRVINHSEIAIGKEVELLEAPPNFIELVPYMPCCCPWPRRARLL